MADWKTSLHAGAMGPGVLGQLIDLPADARDEHQACIRCHAPLAEQADSLAAAIRGTGGGLHAQGLVCAACHLRGHVRFGPPRRDGTLPLPRSPHDGWKAEAAFADSRFCAVCHQFEADGFALNGKLLEDTYQEWRSSRYAREGRSCQSCHMPEGRHLWRGAHDEQMVKSGVAVRTTRPERTGGMVEASLAVRNTGAGHRLPTYVTPAVVVEIYQLDARGATLPGTLRQHVIARRVTLDLSREIADTRLAPDEEATLNNREAAHARARSLAYRVRVEPDAFYTEFYGSILAGGQAVRGAPMIRAALEQSRRSQFTIFEARQPLRPGGETR